MRKGGGEDSVLQTVDWLDEIHRLFPRETIERLERDAVERYEITDVVTDPAVLPRIEPNPALLRAVLRTKHLMNPEVLAMARGSSRRWSRQLMEKLAHRGAAVVHRHAGRRPSSPPQLAQLRLPGHDPGQPRGTTSPKSGGSRSSSPKFVSRTRRHVEQWQVILLVDQSGSMAELGDPLRGHRGLPVGAARAAGRT